MQPISFIINIIISNIRYNFLIFRGIIFANYGIDRIFKTLTSNIIGCMESGKLLPLVRNICASNYSPVELTEFVNISQKIAISYLKYLEIIGRNIRPKKSGGSNELEDVAIDCIAGLFMRNDKGEFIQLKRYFGPKLASDPEPDELELSSMLRRLIVKKTKQELSRIFRERDPEGAKIIRNIKVAIRSSNIISSFKEMGREFIYLNNKPNQLPKEEPEPEWDNRQGDNDISDNSGTEPFNRFKNAIPEKMLFHQFLEKYDPSDSVATMMKKMLEIVESFPEYQNYLPIDVIATIIRDVTFQHVREKLSNNVDVNSPLNDLQSKEIEQVNQAIINVIHKKINQQYLRKKKITPQKAEIYCQAIVDFVNELTQGKETDSNFRYLKRYIPDLTQQDYREKERSIFEYLVKITKKSLRKKLKELL